MVASEESKLLLMSLLLFIYTVNFLKRYHLENANSGRNSAPFLIF